MRTEADLLAKLDRWTKQQLQPPTLRDVLAARDIELFAAYILKGFRQATSEAVAARQRVDEVRAAAVLAFQGDANAAESFLRTADPRLGDKTPLRAIVDDPEYVSVVVQMLGDAAGHSEPP